MRPRPELGGTGGSRVLKEQTAVRDEVTDAHLMHDWVLEKEAVWLLDRRQRCVLDVVVNKVKYGHILRVIVHDVVSAIHHLFWN